MIVPASRLICFLGGAAAGAAATRHYERIKSQVAPVLAAATDAVGDAYTAAARRVAERIETVQDSRAAAEHSPKSGGSTRRAS